MKHRIQSFKVDADYMLRLRTGDQSTEQHFVSYFGKLLQTKIQGRLTCPRHIENIRREALDQALAVIRSSPLTPPEQLSGLVNAICNRLLQNYDPSECCREAGDSLVAHQDEEIDANGNGSILARNLVHEVLHQLSPRDRKILRATVVTNGNGKHEVCDDPDLQKEYVRLVLFQARQIFSSKLRNAQKIKSI